VYHRLGLHEYPNDRALRLAGHGWETLHPGAPAQREVMQRRTRVRRSPRATQLAGIGLGHVENRIESWARAGAAHGIDHRYPLLDRRVLELSLALPPDVWIRDGWDRWPFRRAIAPLLPESVVWAAETEETSRLDLWFELLADAPLDELAGESPLLRAHRRRQQELARILRERRRPPSRP
jgi:asparagine synthetase B (glutamine-hydrolysing)